ncbi:MAG TPA: YtxH domain-containing protein [Pedobacter sp.]|nr:YtxH domain-containing protein [Pedobacter sp.]
MKTRKLIDTLLSGGSSRTPAIAALIGGLAAGAVIGILLAPKSGKAAREKIVDALTGLFGNNSQSEEQEPPVQTHHQPKKRPKSDIGELIHHAHQSEHTE